MTIIILAFGAFFVRRESTPGMIAIIVSLSCFTERKKTLLDILLITFSAPLLCCHGILHLQAVPYVRGSNSPSVHRRPTVNDLLRYRYPDPHRDYHNQRVYVRQQLPPRPQAPHSK